MGHYIVIVSEPQLQIRCLTARDFLPLKKLLYRVFTLVAYMISHMNTLMQNLCFEFASSLGQTHHCWKTGVARAEPLLCVPWQLCLHKMR